MAALGAWIASVETRRGLSIYIPWSFWACAQAKKPEPQPSTKVKVDAAGPTAPLAQALRWRLPPPTTRAPAIPAGGTA